MTLEDVAFQSIVNGGPAWALLYIVWREIREQTRKLDAMTEAIAYWGKRVSK